MGVADAALDQYGYVMATIPATPGKEQVPVIGFIAHVDTSPEVSGTDVRPIVHTNYDGRDLVLPDEPAIVLREADNPELAEQRGNDIITASGGTLLGSDDKAGVAEIMAAAEYLIRIPRFRTGRSRSDLLPMRKSAAARSISTSPVRRALRLHARRPEAGRPRNRKFFGRRDDADVQGFNAHPGYAKGRMVSALKLAAEFVHRLPRHGLSPETTDGYDGYVHPHNIQGGVERATVKMLLRDFTTKGLDDKARMLSDLADEVVRPFPSASVQIERKESYRNMKEVLDRYPGSRRTCEDRDETGRADAAIPRDPRRHRRRAAFVHGIADAKSVRRGAQHSFPP